MPRAQDEPPLIEPEMIHELMMSGVHVIRGPSGVRFVGWISTAAVENAPQERRIILRFAMSEHGARQFRSDLNNVFRGAH